MVRLLKFEVTQSYFIQDIISGRIKIIYSRIKYATLSANLPQQQQLLAPKIT
jgi:hypothetical protein